MTTDELRAILERLSWSQGELARRWRRDVVRVRKMCRGREAISDDEAEWLRKMDRIRAQISDEAWAEMRDVLAHRPARAAREGAEGPAMANIDLATGLPEEC